MRALFDIPRSERENVHAWYMGAREAVRGNDVV
jgi:hypothetical protein